MVFYRIFSYIPTSSLNVGIIREYSIEYCQSYRTMLWIWIMLHSICNNKLIYLNFILLENTYSHWCLLLWDIWYPMNNLVCLKHQNCITLWQKFQQVVTRQVSIWKSSTINVVRTRQVTWYYFVPHKIKISRVDTKYKCMTWDRLLLKLVLHEALNL